MLFYFVLNNSMKKVRDRLTLQISHHCLDIVAQWLTVNMPFEHEWRRWPQYITRCDTRPMLLTWWISATKVLERNVYIIKQLLPFNQNTNVGWDTDLTIEQKFHKNRFCIRLYRSISNVYVFADTFGNFFSLSRSRVSFLHFFCFQFPILEAKSF